MRDNELQSIAVLTNLTKETLKELSPLKKELDEINKVLTRLDASAEEMGNSLSLMLTSSAAKANHLSAALSQINGSKALENFGERLSSLIDSFTAGASILPGIIEHIFNFKNLGRCKSASCFMILNLPSMPKFIQG